MFIWFIIVKEFICAFLPKLHNKRKVCDLQRKQLGLLKVLLFLLWQPDTLGVFIYLYIRMKIWNFSIMFGYTVSNRPVIFTWAPSPCDDGTGQALEDKNIDMDLALRPIVPLLLMDSILEAVGWARREYTCIQFSLVCPAPALQLKTDLSFQGIHTMHSTTWAPRYFWKVVC